jgi:hypothetical protein
VVALHPMLLYELGATKYRPNQPKGLVYLSTPYLTWNLVSFDVLQPCGCFL